MSDPIQLDYADGRSSWSSAAICALVLGLGTGPIVFVVVRLSGIAYGISIVGSGIAVIVSVVVAAYCAWAYKSAKRPQVRGRSLAIAGLAITLAWCVALIALFCYVDAHLD